MEEIDIHTTLLRCNDISRLLGPVELGSALTTTGQLKFFNSSSANATTFQAGNATSAATYTLPTAAPAGNNYLLAGSTAGVLSWINAPGTYAPIGSSFVTIATDATLTSERALTGTANQITITDNGAGGTVVLSTPQNIHTAATPTFASETLTATSNQLVLGTTRTVTITAPTPATSSRTHTIPDIAAAGTFAFLEGTQTFSGTKTFSSIVQFSGTNTTGAGTALLGSNSPAGTLTAPYTWIQITTSDGSTAYFPCWK